MSDMLHEEQIASMPLRAIVAVAARAARRLSGQWSGLAQSDTVNRAIAVAEQMVENPTVDDELLLAASRASRECLAALGSIVDPFAKHAALAAMLAARAAWGAIVAYLSWNQNRRFAEINVRYAAQSALTASRIGITSEENDIAVELATRDYIRLSALYERSPDRVLGPVIDLSEQGPLGPLWPATAGWKVTEEYRHLAPRDLRKKEEM